MSKGAGDGVPVAVAAPAAGMLDDAFVDVGGAAADDGVPAAVADPPDGMGADGIVDLPSAQVEEAGSLCVMSYPCMVLQLC